MSESLRALLRGVIDYAGMFPPAGLPLEEAVAEYRRYRTVPEAWMLGRFVIATEQLEALASIIGRQQGEAEPWNLAVLGRGGADAAAWLAGLEADVARVVRFYEALGGDSDHVEVGRLELRLPAVAINANSAALEDLLAGVAARLRDKLSALPVVFCELPADVRRPCLLPHAVETLARVGRRDQIKLGLKLRTGGLSAADVPSVVEVADVVTVCRDAGLRWKATAGLHHALRGFHQEVRGVMHGFLNLQVAAVLSHASGLSHEMVSRILNDELAGDFHFGHYFLAWRGTSVTVAQVAEAREHGLNGIGSCSFQTPVEDLKALGLL